jgi:Dolichyl-phosphate-mannose-protein mannosyltransferase
VVVLVAVAVLIPKMIIAARTFGTNDVRHWQTFVQAVAERGPVGVYAVHFRDGSFYNHPPLIGYYLLAVNKLRLHGVSVGFTIRSVSSVADVASAVLIYEILRRRRSLAEATLGAVLVAASPVLFIISGFHGNTDPIFAMLVLLGIYLLADRSWPTLAGVTIGLAIGVKVVPVVVIPALLVFAFIKGRSVALRFAAGFTASFLITWGPAMLEQRVAVDRDVLGYAGITTRQWGLVQLGHWAGDPRWVSYLEGSGRFAIVILSAVVPAILAWRRPQMIAECVGLSLCLFFFLSPAWATQYLVWALTASYLLSFGWATAYNISAGILLTVVYNRWSGGFPWNVAHGSPMLAGEVVGAFAVWQILGFTIAGGLVRIWKAGGPSDDAPGAADPAASAALYPGSGVGAR